MLNPIFVLQFIGMLMFAFVPVWAGGQAMRCYQAGHLFRSVLCVWIAMGLNIALVLLAIGYVRYNWNFVTILAHLTL